MRRVEQVGAHHEVEGARGAHALQVGRVAPQQLRRHLRGQRRCQRRRAIGGLEAGWREQPGRRRGARWAGLALGVPRCPEPPGAPRGGTVAELGRCRGGAAEGASWPCCVTAEPPQKGGSPSSTRTQVSASRRCRWDVQGVGCAVREGGRMAHPTWWVAQAAGWRRGTVARRHAARCRRHAARCTLQAAWRTARGLYLQPVGDNVLVEQRQHVRLVAQQHVGAARSRAQPADAGASTQLKNPLTAQ